MTDLLAVLTRIAVALETIAADTSHGTSHTIIYSSKDTPNE